MEPNSQTANQNKKTIYILVVAIIVVTLGGSLFFLQKQQSSTTKVDQNTNIIIQDNGNSETKGSLSNLVNKTEVSNDNATEEYKQAVSQLNKQITTSLQEVESLTVDAKTFDSQQTQNKLKLEIDKIESAINITENINVPKAYSQAHKEIIISSSQYKNAINLMAQSIENKSLSDLENSNNAIINSTTKFNTVYLQIINS